MSAFAELFDSFDVPWSAGRHDEPPPAPTPAPELAGGPYVPVAPQAARVAAAIGEHWTADEAAGQRPVDPAAMSTAANELFKAMDGFGTDEKAIYRALQGKSPAEIAAIKAAYRDRTNGRELGADLGKELDADELKRAGALLGGDQHTAALEALKEAKGTFSTTDPAAVKDALAGVKDPAAHRLGHSRRRHRARRPGRRHRRCHRGPEGRQAEPEDHRRHRRGQGRRGRRPDAEAGAPRRALRRGWLPRPRHRPRPEQDRGDPRGRPRPEGDGQGLRGGDPQEPRGRPRQARRRRQGRRAPSSTATRPRRRRRASITPRTDSAPARRRSIASSRTPRPPRAMPSRPGTTRSTPPRRAWTSVPC